MLRNDPTHVWLSPGKAWFLVFVSFLTYVAGQVDRQIVAMLVEDMKRDLHFTDEQMGVLMGFAFSLTYALSAIFVSYVGDRVSRKKVLAAGVALWSVLTIMCGVARSFPSLLMARLGVGVGESVLAPMALPMIAGAFPPDKRAFPIAFCISGSAVGLIVTPILIGYVIHATSGMVYGPYPVVGAIRGWQLSFFLGGFIGLITLVLLCFVTEPEKEITAAEAVGIGEGFAHYFRHWKFYGDALLTVPLLMSANYALIAWMPAYLSRTFGLDSIEIGALNGVAFIPAAVVAPVIAGYVGQYAARTENARAHTNIMMYMIPLGAFLMASPMLMPTVTLCIAMFATTTTYTTVVIAFGMINVQQAIMPRYRSQCTAILMAVIILFGAGTGPMIVGAFTTRVVGEDSIGIAMLLALAITIPLALMVALIAKFDRSEAPQSGDSEMAAALI